MNTSMKASGALDAAKLRWGNRAEAASSLRPRRLSRRVPCPLTK
jgi:hypothetical protein